MGEKIESLSSITSQTHPNLEIIIEYDYYQQGASAARNRGAKKAQGDYIFFCDNDVELEPDILEKMVEKLQGSEYGWCFGKLQVGEIVLNEDRQPINRSLSGQPYIDQFSCISTMSLIKKECNPVFDVDMLRYNDWDLWLRLEKEGHKGVFIDKLVLKTYDRPNRKGISTGEHGSSFKWEKAIKARHL